ncbi:MAG: tetratricopeptide repeat protein [Smithella sp.]|nr:tetratricopeptide repeat protein [Smithella sp.]
MPALICLALVMVTIAAFWQLKDSGFVNFDDQLYVYENAYIQSGLNFDSIKLAFSSDLAKYSGHWHPLTWLSLMLDHSLFGLNPAGYHLVNLLFHVLNTVLLFLVLRRMTKATWPCAFVAALFAIHPLHVESVAWVVERKDVLSTFFWMLTMGAYSYYVEQKTVQRYAFVVLFFILGLMSKPMLVTLPFVLLLLDFWPLQRFSEAIPAPRIPAAEIKPEVSGKKKKSGKKDAEKAAVAVKVSEVTKPAVAEFKWSLIYPLLLEKVPLFVLAVLSSIVTYIAAHSSGTAASLDVLTPSVRIGNALVSYVVYIGKMIVPVNLAVFYPHPGNVVLWQVLGAAIFLIAATSVVIWKAKKLPYLATGWCWYLGTLLPVIGIVQVGIQAMADRYTYVSLIGLFIMAAWGIPELLKNWKHRREILAVVSALSILVFSIITWNQTGYWKNSITLFDHVLNVTRNNWLINNNRGLAYKNLGDYPQAIKDFDEAIRIKPEYAEAYYNRGLAHKALGNAGQAIADYSRAIRLKPNMAEAYNNRGNAYGESGDCNLALMDFKAALEINPSFAEAYMNRGNAYNCLGNYQQAIEDYGRAIEKKPDYAASYYNRAVAYSKMGNGKLAILDLKTAAGLGDERAKNFLRSKGINW